MAGEPVFVSTAPSKNNNKRKRTVQQNAELERLDSLKWKASLSGDDPFSLNVGSNELDGGFLSLEEIDEVEYGLEIPKPERESRKEKTKPGKKSKKRKSSDIDRHGGDGIEAEVEEKLEKDENVKAEKKKKKKRKKKKKAKGAQKIEDIEGSNGEGIEVEDDEKEKDGNMVIEQKDKKAKKKKVVESLENEESEAVINGEGNIEEDPVDDAEYYAWNEMRLHPLIMKSIYRLGFKEPTPIQKACIPAAAHQGRDVVGAAETGSGKTLAFGLPIFQRLLEEQEKAANVLEEKGEEAEKFAPKGLLRALIITPTRELGLQITKHLEAVAEGFKVRVISIVGGMSKEKQERLLKSRPEIVVGTPGRLWEFMSEGEEHLVELHSLSFFVLDEADRMIQDGHFHELQSIVDMLPNTNGSIEGHSQNTQNCITVSSVQRKKRQTFVFSATIALSADFHKKLKRGTLKRKQLMSDGLNSIEALSERVGMRDNVAIIDLTNASIMANKLEESFIECKEEDKDAYLYYILSVHGHGRTIVFCTSIAALRHISSVLRILDISVWPLHAQMQQRARLKAIDRFRENEHGILVATDVAARGLDIPGVRTVVHYQLPHSAEVYIHRSGRTARASADGCSIALITPNETSKFASLCKSFSKASFQRFPLENSFMPAVMKRLSLARQIDKVLHKDSKEREQKSWFERNAESVELLMDDDESEDEIAKNHKQKKVSSANLKKLQQELKTLLSRPLQLQSFSRRFLAGAGVSPLLQHQFEELAKQNMKNSGEIKRRKLVVIGQDCVEPLQALRNAGQQVNMDVKETTEKRRNMEDRWRKRKQEKKHLKDQRRKQRKKLKGAE